MRIAFVLVAALLSADTLENRAGFPAPEPACPGALIENTGVNVR